MNELFEKIYAASNIETEESRQTELFERIYNESEMLNEMNPKLRALLAAGLIGTASLGAASCSMPTDDPYIPAIENPAPDDTDKENTDEENTDEENTDEENTDEEKQMSAWEELGIEETDWNNIMAPATNVIPITEGRVDKKLGLLSSVNIKKYTESGFVPLDLTDTVERGIAYYQQNTFAYFIPSDQVQRFYAKGAKQPVAK
jgi:hypothetical protein